MNAQTRLIRVLVGMKDSSALKKEIMDIVYNLEEFCTSKNIYRNLDN